MESRWGLIVALVILACVCALSHSAQVKLDNVRGQERFREFMYLPSGRALKISSFGFDAPIADSLYIKTLLYYSDNMRAKMKQDRAAQHKYLFQAFDVITELNPRYYHAYYYGGLLLGAAGKPEMAIKLLEKGLKQYPADWQLHMHLAVTADIQLKDRELALKHYRLAAACPGVPMPIINAWAGMELEGVANASEEKQLDFQIALWSDALKDPNHRKEFREHAQQMLDRMETRRLTLKLTTAAKKFIAARKRSPRSLEELLASEFFSGQAIQYLEDDRLVMAPDGEVVSTTLAKEQLKELIDSIDSAAKQYKKKWPEPILGTWQLYITKQIRAIPAHPLAKFGYRVDYDTFLDKAVEIKPGR